MTRFLLSFVVLTALSGCSEGTNPFSNEEDTASTSGSTTTNTGDPISSNRTILPGTANPAANDAIFRREATGDEVGSGYAEGFRYDGDTDTFYVDNLAFDGEGGYSVVRDGGGNRLGIGPFTAFENSATAADGLTSASINQLEYRALYAVSADQQSSIAIVRSGAYVEYGFGGFIYQREGGVTLPETGQAVYSGTNNYGGLRDFKGQGGMEYVTGDAEVRIDFSDFNEGAGVIGYVRNRRVFDMDLTDVTPALRTGLGGATALPVLQFVIEPGVLDSNGELTGEVQSVDPRDGSIFETGNYYALLSGDNAQTITGVIVVTGEDPRNSAITVRETGGFFATRN